MDPLPIKFRGFVTLLCGPKQYPSDTLNAVVVSNTDQHTYEVVPIRDGTFNLNFLLQALAPGVRIVDTLKFHFYSGKVPVLVTSGFVLFEELLRPRCSARFKCNTTENIVTLDLRAEREYHYVPGTYARSALRDSAKASQMFALMTDQLDRSLNHRLEVDPKIGAPLFTTISTQHCMYGQDSMYTHYEHDFEPTPDASVRFHKSGLTMLSVADTMHFMTMTHSQVFAAPDLKRTQFASQASQQCQRSAHVIPYYPDLQVQFLFSCGGDDTLYYHAAATMH